MELPNHSSQALKVAVDDIDCFVFTGTQFHDDQARAALREYMKRWEGELVSIDKLKEEENK